MLICLDAMERALREECEAVLLVSSDQDFTHLATRLRGYGLTVIGAGETKTPDRFSAAWMARRWGECEDLRRVRRRSAEVRFEPNLMVAASRPDGRPAQDASLHST